MRRNVMWIAVLLVIGGIAPSAQPPTPPTIDQVISLKRVGLEPPALSPDGRSVAYAIMEPNWDANFFRSEIWLADVQAGTTRQLTTAGGFSGAPAWSPDGRTLAFTSIRGPRRQVYLIDAAGGETRALTSEPTGVNDFAWSPDGTRIAYTSNEPRSQVLEERDRKYGSLELVDEEPARAHLRVIDVATKASRRLTEGPYTVGWFSWSPDGTRIAFDRRADQDMNHWFESGISVVTVADANVRPLVTQPSLNEHPVWSPDGARIAFLTTMGHADAFYDTPVVIAVVPAGGGPVSPLTRAFENLPIQPCWGPPGIFFWSLDRGLASIFRADPVTGRVERVGPAPGKLAAFLSFSRDFSMVAYGGADARTYEEIYVAPVKTMEARSVTSLGAQIAAWPQHTREIVTWRSPDGTEISGILHKPAGFKPGATHPLLVAVHGGPTSSSFLIPFGNAEPYPIEQWLDKGALVLEPNYRGSAGYGAKFRSLNIRNLGFGDAGDVLAGIDALIARGLVDKDRVGVMGWSHGGYISAFLATHDSGRFKAASVGAGTPDSIVNYVDSDLHTFARHFLGATPWDDPAIYAKTSPITYIKQARTPVLIQHGGSDSRVPLAGAYELYQGLKDQHVPTRLAVFAGAGHMFTTPKAIRAAMEQNFEWFNRYIWGEEPAAGSPWKH